MPELRTLTRPLVEDPLLPPTPVAVLRRRVAWRRFRRRAATTSIALVVAAAFVVAGLANRHARGRQRVVTEPTAPETYRDSVHGFSVLVPPGWHRATESLTPQLADPVTILSLGTGPLRVATDCAHLAEVAVAAAAPAGAFVSVEERSRASAAEPRPRPLPLPTTSAGGECAPRGAEVRVELLSFSDSGRTFHLLVAIGSRADPAMRHQARQVLESLTFDRQEPPAALGGAARYPPPASCPYEPPVDPGPNARQEVLAVARAQLPERYGQGSIDTTGYTLTASPATADVAYAAVARSYCGPYVAQRTWLALFTFPRTRSASLGGGQLFMAKRPDGRWQVWLQYH